MLYHKNIFKHLFRNYTPKERATFYLNDLNEEKLGDKPIS